MLREVRELLDPTAVTVTGRPLVDYLDDAQIWDPEVIRLRRQPLLTEGGIAVLHGNLAPAGAIIKPAAASPRLLTGTADVPSCSTASRTSTPGSTTPISTSTPTPCWCCAAAGPEGIRACRRSRTCRCRRNCSNKGVRDMVRICDGRMSGTAYGTVVLHVAPEAAAGGPLAIVQTGDEIILDVPSRTSTSRSPAEELTGVPNPPPSPGSPAERGWERLYIDHVRRPTGRRSRLPRRRHGRSGEP